MSDNLLYLHDAAGKLMAVQIPATLWQKLAPTIANLTETSCETDKPATQHDLQGFSDFMNAWDFRYAYAPTVTCPNCQNHTDDWQSNNAFILLNANIGGLLVFHCQKCQATVRLKYYKDHVASEFSPPPPPVCG